MKPTPIVASLITVMATLIFAADRPRIEEEHGWVKLGTRTVGFKAEEDVIEVGRVEGRFNKIRFTVEEGDLFMEKVRVIFADGEPFSPSTRLEFREGQRSRDIDLPGEARVIRRVEFFYKSEHPRERAVIDLYGHER